MVRSVAMGLMVRPEMEWLARIQRILRGVEELDLIRSPLGPIVASLWGSASVVDRAQFTKDRDANFARERHFIAHTLGDGSSNVRALRIIN